MGTGAMAIAVTVRRERVGTRLGQHHRIALTMVMGISGVYCPGSQQTRSPERATIDRGKGIEVVEDL